MKKVLTILLIAALMLSSPAVRSEKCVLPDLDGFTATMSDWILGSGWGILTGEIDLDRANVTMTLPGVRLAKLTEQDRLDIRNAVQDILELYIVPASASREFTILYKAEEETEDASLQPESAKGTAAGIVNLIFIHHSCGENWLRDGLNEALNTGGYHVADITYGWREYGDRTDTSDWPMWFSEKVMSLVYNEKDTMTARNSIAEAEGENTIVMFKSCFPCSDVGGSNSDEKAVYNSLLPYFTSRPDKMFILITPPPMIRISNPEKTRELCNWLADRQDGWLSGYAENNVYVFDFYNVLTHPGAHHMIADGIEVHEVAGGADTLYYDSNGDDHPNAEGNKKAAAEFIGLLDVWYQSFLSR